MSVEDSDHTRRSVLGGAATVAAISASGCMGGDSGPATPVETTFQQGEDGYTGTVDTILHEENPDSSYADEETITIDERDPHDGGGRVHGLLKFEGLVGSDAIPEGSEILEATLTVETTNPSPGAAFHRMLQPWSEDDTWNDRGPLSTDGEVATESPVDTIESPEEGPTELDVAEAVQAWADGEENHGFAILPLDVDGWDFQTSEGETPPALQVRYQ